MLREPRLAILLAVVLTGCSGPPTEYPMNEIESTHTGARPPAGTTNGTAIAADSGAEAPRESHARATENSILASSSPADGSTVDGPVDQLKLRFSVPARLMEVTVTGPDGSVMPTMITAAGELRDFSVPISATESGGYRVEWRATAAGAEHSSAFGFTVR